MTEWRLIPGYDGLYRVSNDGRVQSCSSSSPRRGGRGAWWDMSLTPDRIGYPLVYLWDRTKHPHRVRRLVHQLVAELFLPVPSAERTCVNHLNGIKDDNRAENLEWCTRLENMRHAWTTGLCRPQKLTADAVREILTCGGNDTTTAARFGVSQVLVTKIRARKLWRHVS